MDNEIKKIIDLLDTKHNAQMELLNQKLESMKSDTKSKGEMDDKFLASLLNVLREIKILYGEISKIIEKNNSIIEKVNNIISKIEKLEDNIVEILNENKNSIESKIDKVRDDIKEVKEYVKKYEHLYKWVAIILGLFSILIAFAKGFFDILRDLIK